MPEGGRSLGPGRAREVPRRGAPGPARLLGAPRQESPGPERLEGGPRQGQDSGGLAAPAKTCRWRRLFLLPAGGKPGDGNTAAGAGLDWTGRGRADHPLTCKCVSASRCFVT